MIVRWVRSTSRKGFVVSEREFADDNLLEALREVCLRDRDPAVEAVELVLDKGHGAPARAGFSTDSFSELARYLNAADEDERHRV